MRGVVRNIAGPARGPPRRRRGRSRAGPAARRLRRGAPGRRAGAGRRSRRGRRTSPFRRAAPPSPRARPAGGTSPRRRGPRAPRAVRRRAACAARRRGRPCRVLRRDDGCDRRRMRGAVLHQDDGGRATDAAPAARRHGCDQSCGSSCAACAPLQRLELLLLQALLESLAVALRIRIGWVPSPCDASGRLRDHAHS